MKTINKNRYESLEAAENGYGKLQLIEVISESIVGQYKSRQHSCAAAFTICTADGAMHYLSL